MNVSTKGNFAVNDSTPHRQAPERRRSEAEDLSYVGNPKSVADKSPTAIKTLFVSQTISENASTCLRWLTSGQTKPLASPAFPSLANALANPLRRYKRAGQSFPCPVCRSYLANARRLSHSGRLDQSYALPSFIFNNGLDGLTHYSTDLENEVWKLWNLHGFYSLPSTQLNHHCEGSVTHWLFLSSSLS